LRSVSKLDPGQGIWPEREEYGWAYLNQAIMLQPSTKRKHFQG